MSSNAIASSRSVYVSQLRRAFLLRAHPDRFRNHSQNVVKCQAEIIQALSERLAAPDFSAYVANEYAGNNSVWLQNDTHKQQWKSQKFYLEKKNGELMQHSIPLNENAEEVLKSLSKALESTGLVSFKKPPSSPPTNTAAKWAHYNANQGGSINHSFDINTNRGRDLLNFIENVDKNDIEQLKSHRIDASAAALITRQVYKFKSVDGTGLGWSSSSLTKTLKILTKVYDEHHTKFNVQSFYPLQLILSNDEFHKKLDVYGGKLMLNPGSTQIQWLETLMAVTDDMLEILEKNRKQINENHSFVQNSLNVKIRKGFSCSSEEYYMFLKLASEQLQHQQHDKQIQQSSNKSLEPNRVGLVVETAQACRKPVVTSNGEIRISSSMLPHLISSSLISLRSDALLIIREEAEKKLVIKQIESMLMHEFGLTKVHKTGYNKVSNDQYIKALSKLLHCDETSKLEIKKVLAGNGIGITGSGPCRLADSGDFLIPWDWSRQLK